MVLIIIAVIIGCISIGCFVYSMFAFHEKGPILMNEYILATAEEKIKLARQKPEKRKKDYHMAAKVFLVLSIIFILLSLGCLLHAFNIQDYNIITGIIIFLAIVLILYVVITAIRDGEFS